MYIDSVTGLRCLVAFAAISGAPIWATAGVDSILGWQTSVEVRANTVSSLPVPDAHLTTTTVDRFGGNWYALRVPAEAAAAWDTLPAMAELDLDAQRHGLEIHLVLPLRRDLESWMDDPLHGNWITSANDLDINVPYEGWISAQTSLGAFKMGRFRYNFSPTTHGVILAGTPRHDGLLWSLPLGRVHYGFFASSLNPWLNGTATDTAGNVAGSGTTNVESTTSPHGSETWQQSHEALGDQNGRIYDDPYKTLFMHSLGIQLGPADLTLVEQTLVGGKSPEFRDLNPFIVWHDSYGDGYSRSFFSLDLRVQGGESGFFWGQISTQLIKSPIGENNYDPALQAAAAAGWSNQWHHAGGMLTASVDFATTTPTFDNHLLPLLKMTSRRLYRSNYRNQLEANYADVYEVDYPLSYQRGPDALDLWTRIGWDAPLTSGGSHGGSLEIDVLQQGDASLDTSAATYIKRDWPLSGIVERELRLIFETHRDFEKFWRLQAGFGASIIRNCDHESGNTEFSPLWSLGLGFRY